MVCEAQDPFDYVFDAWKAAEAIFGVFFRLS
jgi:hypothetical protein